MKDVPISSIYLKLGPQLAIGKKKVITKRSVTVVETNVDHVATKPVEKQVIATHFLFMYVL